jgi:hypothetical protein
MHRIEVEKQAVSQGEPQGTWREQIEMMMASRMGPEKATPYGTQVIV